MNQLGCNVSFFLNGDDPYKHKNDKCKPSVPHKSDNIECGKKLWSYKEIKG